MTLLLEQALEKISALPDSEQDGIAALILSELEDEQRWDEAFAKSQDKLAKLSAKVDEDVRAGRVSSGASMNCEIGDHRRFPPTLRVPSAGPKGTCAQGVAAMA
jgi:hypothetical protein